MSTFTKLASARRVTAVAGAAFATALTLAACGGGASSPDGAVESFLDDGVEDYATAFGESDFDRVVEISEDYFCASDVSDIKEMAAMMEEASDEEMEAMGDNPADIPEDWSYEITETTEDGDSATVTVDMTADGETTSEDIELVKEEDEWKLCGFGL